MVEIAQWSTQTRAYFQHSAAFYHLLGRSDEPFLYSGNQSNLAYECLEDSEEESDNEEGCGDSMQRNIGAADLLQWNQHKTNRRSMKDIVHNDKMPTPIGPVK